MNLGRRAVIGRRTFLRVMLLGARKSVYHWTQSCYTLGLFALESRDGLVPPMRAEDILVVGAPELPPSPTVCLTLSAASCTVSLTVSAASLAFSESDISTVRKRMRRAVIRRECSSLEALKTHLDFRLDRIIPPPFNFIQAATYDTSDVSEVQLIDQQKNRSGNHRRMGSALL